jgi:hypothetical protein
VTAQALRQLLKVLTLRLQADSRNLAPVHLVHDLLESIVVPHDDRKREPLFGRRSELIDRELMPPSAATTITGRCGRADLGPDGHRQGDAQATVRASRRHDSRCRRTAQSDKLNIRAITTGANNIDALSRPRMLTASEPHGSRPRASDGDGT